MGDHMVLVDVIVPKSCFLSSLTTTEKRADSFEDWTAEVNCRTSTIKCIIKGWQTDLSKLTKKPRRSIHLEELGCLLNTGFNEDSNICMTTTSMITLNFPRGYPNVRNLGAMLASRIRDLRPN
ncbi:hypothetical protein Nepgr_017303 [Nepenthes gracilis]|uniref:Uncharacterized protein n=1 Tax=Nepenthes gracilis TaxID=150966 RepID=A0AAD3XS17_NEPGR|nr:hypothetical protein Nepgr_017303 [Nepenthes gracilis]